MIRKIPNLNAWVLKVKDITTLFNTNRDLNGYEYIIDLPLFYTTPPALFVKFYWQSNGVLEDDPNRIVLVIDHIMHRCTNFTLEEVETINKIWNEFLCE